MAKFEAKLPDDLFDSLVKLGNRTDEVIDKMLKAGAKVAEKQVKVHLAHVVGNNLKPKPNGEPAETRSTGELQDSLGISPVAVDKNGISNIKIWFNEPRRKQYAAKSTGKYSRRQKGKRSYNEITNAMIANVLEYGKHGQPPKPFAAPAKKAAEKPCIEAMTKVFNEEVNR